MNQSLPQVVLLASFFGPFAALLRDSFKHFQREEGGYLLGRFRGGCLEIEAFYHDNEAESSAGDIRLSMASFDYANAQAKLAVGRKVIGTWHLHPPGYGAHYSTTDEQSLFIDRMVLNATDPHDYDTPWIHIIVPGVELAGMRAYTLDLCSDVDLTLAGCVDCPDGVAIPSERRFGLLVGARREGQTQFYPMTRRLFGAALRADRLTGFWRWCPPGPTSLRWEQLFVENFIRKVHAAGPRATGLVGRRFTYCRLVPQGTDGVVTEERYWFSLPRECGREEFVSLPVGLELVLQNPDTDASRSLIVPAGMRVAALICEIQEQEKLARPPVLWSLMNSTAAERLKQRTHVEEFGKVYLPEDLSLAEVWAQRETPDVPLYWQSPDLAPDVVRRLRTHRFADMGYDLEQLRNRQVVVAGVGLIGCGIARALGTLAVGHLTLIDHGHVDWVDVYRQALYEPEHVGRPKVEAAASELTRMGCACESVHLEIPSVLVPDVEAATRSLQILAEAVKRADVVVGALDSFSSRVVMQVICRIYGVPYLAAALDYVPQLDMTQGTITLYAGSEGQCYGCGCGLKMQADRGACTMAPLEFPGIVNSLAAKVVIEALTNPRSVTPLTYRVYHDYRIERHHLGPAAEGCEACNLGRQGAALSMAKWSELLLRWLIA